MKNLQVESEFRWNFSVEASTEGARRSPANPTQVILLLHGLNERGRRIFRKLLPYLPQSALILAPNAPYPLANQSENGMSLGYTWYFFDRSTKTYLTPVEIPVGFLTTLLAKENPSHLPVSVIGFSQGGYLAPRLAFKVPEVTKVIGIGCEFRVDFFPQTPAFELTSIHGALDSVIPASMAKDEIEKLRMKNIACTYKEAATAGHEINEEVGKLIQGMFNGT